MTTLGCPQLGEVADDVDATFQLLADPALKEGDAFATLATLRDSALLLRDGIELNKRLLKRLDQRGPASTKSLDCCVATSHNTRRRCQSLFQAAKRCPEFIDGLIGVGHALVAERACRHIASGQVSLWNKNVKRAQALDLILTLLLCAALLLLEPVEEFDLVIDLANPPPKCPLLVDESPTSRRCIALG